MIRSSAVWRVRLVAWLATLSLNSGPTLPADFSVGKFHRVLMFAAYVGLAIVSAILLAAVSGLGKLRRNPYIVKSLHNVVGVPMRWFPFLAGLEFAAALGLLVGIRWAPLGIAAAGGMTLYFVGAIVAHARVKDWKGAGPAVQMLCLAVAGLTTRTLSM